MANRRWDKEAVIDALRSLLAKKGRLAQVLINKAEGAPSVTVIIKHFGAISAAYAAIGYKPLPKPSADGKYWSNEEILEGLRKLHKARGYILCRRIITFLAFLRTVTSRAALAPFGRL